MEGKVKNQKSMGWVERFGDVSYFLLALPSPPLNYLQTPQPNKPTPTFCFSYNNNQVIRVVKNNPFFTRNVFAQASSLMTNPIFGLGNSA
jgi:hypothetical protein